MWIDISLLINRAIDISAIKDIRYQLHLTASEIILESVKIPYLAFSCSVATTSN